MLTIGLTGGIGSGKSEAAHLFQQLGVPVIDADNISHQLVQAGSDTLNEVVSAFGEKILMPDGSLDRAMLAGIIFNDSEQKKKLESIIHPRVREQIRIFKDEHKDHPYILVVIPLLLESGQRDLVDRVLVVNATESVRIKRVQARDGRGEKQIRSIISSQADDAAREAAADENLDNSGTVGDLQSQVYALHQHYVSLANSEHGNSA
jgi:dephospho-CoA kinase